MNRSRLAWIAACLALAVVGLCMLVRLRSSVRHGVGPHALNARVETSDALEGDDTPDDERSPTGSKADDAELRRGILRVHVFDGSTKAPLAGIECLVYSERGGNRLHGRITTDVDGRAQIEKLPANTILVEARRKPPYAAGFAGIWLEEGESADVDIALVAGGTLSGRVVDDLQQPVEGAELLLVEDVANRFLPHEPPSIATHVAAKTGADGRFVLEHVVSRPAGVWIVRGEMRPEHWDTVGAIVQLGERKTYVQAHVKPGAKVDVGNVELRRSCLVRGRVVDARSTPIEGALVSAEPRRAWARSASRTDDANYRRWPGLEGFRTFPGEALSAPDGSFQVSAFHGGGLVVWTRAGILESFHVEGVEAGAIKDDVELRLKDWNVLEIELVDSNGKRVDRPVRRFAALAPMLWRVAETREFEDRARITLEFGEDVEQQCTPAADLDGNFRVQHAGSLDGLRRVHVLLDGYEPAVEDVANVSSGQRLRLSVREQPAIRLHVSIDDQADPLPGQRAKPIVILHACMIDPARGAQNDAARRFGMVYGCCGLGTEVRLPLASTDRVIEIPVGASKPFWIYARSVFSVNEWSHVFGPFAASARSDSETHEIEVPTIEPTLWRAVQDMFADSAPSDTQPGDDEDVGTAEVRIVDVRTGAPLAHAHLRLERMRSRGFGPSYDGESGADGKAKAMRVATGRWRAHVEADHYVPSREAWIQVRSDAKLDLGTVALEPKTETAVTVLESDGSPAPRGTNVSILDTSTFLVLAHARVESDDGRSMFDLHFPRSFVLAASGPEAGSEGGSWPECQRIVVDRRDEDPVVVRLAPWQLAEIRILGPVSEPPLTNLRVVLTPDSLQDSGLAGVFLTCRELSGGPQAVRRFVARVAAGSYRVRGESPLFHIEETSIEVKDMAGTQTFALSSTP